MPVIVHVRKAGGTTLRAYLRRHWQLTNRTHAHIEFGMLPLPCLRQPDLLFVLALRHPVDRQVSEYYYAGPGSRGNLSAGRDPAAWRRWIEVESPDGTFSRGAYASNYFVRALTGLCRHRIECPMSGGTGSLAGVGLDEFAARLLQVRQRPLHAEFAEVVTREMKQGGYL